MGFNCTVEVKTSREVKVCGMIGAGTSLKVNSQSVSENEIGVGGTSQWRLPAANSQEWLLIQYILRFVAPDVGRFFVVVKMQKRHYFY